MNWAGRSILTAISALCLLAAVPAAGTGASATGVEGRLVHGGDPAQGGRVSAYRTIDLTSDPAAVSGPSDTEGRYTLDLPPGTYYLAASSGDKWSWCGQNPVTINAGERPWIGFVLSRWVEPDVRLSTDGGGSVVGKALRGGEPAEDVTVSLYFDEADGFRGMPFMRTPPTGPDGVFKMELVPEGTYYLIARRRGTGLGVGPMMKGDLISWYRYNPVRISPDREVRVVLPLVAKRLEREIHGSPSGDRPGFTGAVLDERGRPVTGVHVFAYREPEMGHHKPAALSSTTDREGTYRIYLPEAGRYYVGARQGYGDNPSPGEMFGHYEGTPDHSLELEEGQYVTGIDLVVRRVLVP